MLKTRHALLILYLTLPLFANEDAPSTAPLFNARQTSLLTRNHYAILPDGKVLSPSSAPVSAAELPYLIQNLESAQRLQALIHLDLILNKSEGDTNAAAQSLQALRDIARENWAVLPAGTRKDLKKYFNAEELETLNQDIKSIPMASVAQSMKDPEPAEDIHSSSASTIITITSTISTPAVTSPPLTPQQTYTPTQPTPVEVHSQPQPYPIYLSGLLQSQIPTAPAVASAATSVSTSAADTPLNAPVSLPHPLDISTAAIVTFLDDASYGREAKGLLLLIAEKTPASFRARALAALTIGLPRITFDQDRLGGQRRFSVLTSSRAVIVLANDFILQTAPRVFGTEQETLLAESTRFYSERSLAPPALKALDRSLTPSGMALSDWGELKIYSDYSRRGKYSNQEQAGALLNALLTLYLQQNNLDASPYISFLYARLGEFRFYERLRREAGGSQFLDPSLRAQFELWLTHPDDYRDYLMHTLSAGRANLFTPERALLQDQRHAAIDAERNCAADYTQKFERTRTARRLDAEALRAAGLYDKDSINTAINRINAVPAPTPPDDFRCHRLLEDEIAALQRAHALLQEMLTLELRFQEDQNAPQP